MTSPLAGAKQARKEIEKFHAMLNVEGFVPEQCYRMSHGRYRMVSYVNQVVALFLSRNYYVIPLFISRAIKEADRHQQPNTKEYRSLVTDYFCQMSWFLKKYSEVEEEHLAQWIPPEILNGGERVAPKFDPQTMQVKNV